MQRVYRSTSWKINRNVNYEKTTSICISRYLTKKILRRANFKKYIKQDHTSPFSSGRYLKSIGSLTSWSEGLRNCIFTVTGSVITLQYGGVLKTMATWRCTSACEKMPLASQSFNANRTSMSSSEQESKELSVGKQSKVIYSFKIYSEVHEMNKQKTNKYLSELCHRAEIFHLLLWHFHSSCLHDKSLILQY